MVGTTVLGIRSGQSSPRRSCAPASKSPLKPDSTSSKLSPSIPRQHLTMTQCRQDCPSFGDQPWPSTVQLGLYQYDSRPSSTASASTGISCVERASESFVLSTVCAKSSSSSKGEITTLIYTPKTNRTPKKDLKNTSEICGLPIYTRRSWKPSQL